MSVFAIESQSEDESTRDRSVLHTQMDICSHFLYISRHFSVYRYANDCASPEMQLYGSQPIKYSANESLNAISSDRVLLFTFLLMARKLYFILLQGTEEI